MLYRAVIKLPFPKGDNYMITARQKEWVDGKHLPPKMKQYKNIEAYITDVQRYVPVRVTEAYKDYYGKRGY